MTHPTASELEQAHRYLLRLFELVAAQAASGDYIPADALWDKAATAHERHMQDEELAFDRIEESDPSRAELIALLRADHRALRACVATLGVELQLHVASVGALTDFIDALRSHTAREESSLYTWLQEPRHHALRRQRRSSVPIGAVLRAAAGGADVGVHPSSGLGLGVLVVGGGGTTPMC